MHKKVTTFNTDKVTGYSGTFDRMAAELCCRWGSNNTWKQVTKYDTMFAIPYKCMKLVRLGDNNSFFTDADLVDLYLTSAPMGENLFRYAHEVGTGIVMQPTNTAAQAIGVRFIKVRNDRLRQCLTRDTTCLPT